MDEKLARYEAKKEALNKQFKKQYLKVWIIWLIYNAVADTAIFLLEGVIGLPFAIVAFLVSTGLSLYLAFKSTAELKCIKSRQETLLMEEMPVGKIRI